MTQSKANGWFTSSAGVLLMAAGTAMFVSTGANAGFIPPHDPLFAISMRVMFYIIGALELGIGTICLFGKDTWLKLCLVLWFALNFCAYQLGLVWAVGPRSFNGYWSSLAEAFGISPFVVNLILKIVLLYLLVGSFALAAWTSGQKSAKKENEAVVLERAGRLKMTCVLCKEHIEFSEQNLGQQTLCPHCKATITLMPPKNIKTACPFCGGNLEFPLHGIRQTIACPHCTAPITLGLNDYKVKTHF